jgi:hypothetical protein
VDRAELRPARRAAIVAIYGRAPVVAFTVFRLRDASRPEVVLRERGQPDAAFDAVSQPDAALRDQGRPDLEAEQQSRPDATLRDRSRP